MFRIAPNDGSTATSCTAGSTENRVAFSQEPFVTEARRTSLRRPLNRSPTGWRNKAFNHQAGRPGVRLHEATNSIRSICHADRRPRKATPEARACHKQDVGRTLVARRVTAARRNGRPTLEQRPSSIVLVRRGCSSCRFASCEWRRRERCGGSGFSRLILRWCCHGEAGILASLLESRGCGLMHLRHIASLSSRRRPHGCRAAVVCHLRGSTHVQRPGFYLGHKHALGGVKQASLL